jgi:hypothetical protein
MIEIKPVQDQNEKRLFLTFPWRIYKDDSLWVPPLISERTKVIDPRRGMFFKDGSAELFLAWKDGASRRHPLSRGGQEQHAHQGLRRMHVWVCGMHRRL